MLASYPDILRFYLSESQRITARITHPDILKTDLFNEANDYPIPGGIAGNLQGKVQALDVNPLTVRTAQRKVRGGSFGVGDIRCLPYADSSFDVVIDLSTIDHVPQGDALRVIDEYARVCRRDAYLLLVVWYTPNYRELPPVGADCQHFFDQPTVEMKLNAQFAILEQDTIFRHPDDPSKYLVRYVALRR